MAGRFPRRVSRAGGLTERNAQRAAAIFYVDPSGSDAADGLSTGTAWQTVSKVNAGSFIAGDSILFKQTGTWRGTQLTVPAAGITIGAYGTGAAPILSGGVLVTGWSVFSGNTYSAAIAATTNYVLAGSTPLTLGSGSGSLAANQFFYSAGTLYVNLGGTNPSSLTVEASQLSTVAFVNTRSGVTFQDIELRFSTNQALRFDACASALAQRCTFKYHAFTSNSGTILIQNGNGVHITSCTFDSLQNDGVYVHNNQNVEIDHCTMTGIGALAGDVQSDGIQVDDASFGSSPSSNGLHIHDNTITLAANSPKGCILVAADPGIGGTATGIVELNTCNGGNYGVAIAASGVTARNNTLANQSTSFGGGIHMAALYAVTGVVITYNLIYGSSRDGIVIQDGAFDQQVTIAQNTIADCARAQMYLGSPVYGTIEDNILWNTGAAPSLRTLYILSVTAGQTLTVDYNLFQTAFGSYLRFGGTAYSTLAAWRSATSFDTHSISADPLFTNPGSSIYFLQSGSPAIDAGTIVGGIGQIYNGTAPDIGAFERIAFVSASTSTSTFNITRTRAATFTSTGTSTSAFAPSVKRVVTFSSAGLSTSAFALHAKRAVTFSSAGTSTSTFVPHAKRALSFASTGASSSTFAPSVRRALTLTSAGTSTSTFAPRVKRAVAFTSAGASTSTFATNVKRALTLTSAGLSTSSFALHARRAATFTSASTSTSTWIPIGRRAVAFASASTSASTFTASKAGALVFTSAATSTSTFAPRAKRAVAFTSAGTSTSTFAANRWRSATFASASSSTSVFSRTAKRALAFSSTGASTSVFTATRISSGITFTSNSTSTSTFTPHARRGVAFTSSSISTSTFSRTARRAITFTSASTSTSVFSRGAVRGAVFASASTGTSVFALHARRALTLVSTAFSTSTFTASLAGAQVKGYGSASSGRAKSGAASSGPVYSGKATAS